MTESAPTPSEEVLHAYLDGFLPASQRPGVEAWLAANPEEAARIEDYRRQNEALRALGAEMSGRPFVMPDLSRRLRRLPLLGRAAAAVLLVALGGTAGWWLRGERLAPTQEWQRLVQQAAVAHRTYAPEVRHPVEVTRDEQQHLTTWLSKRLGNPLRIPTLEAMGFELMGGRLLPAGEGPAAQFMYQDAAGVRLTLYVLTPGQPRQKTSFQYVQRGSLWLCYWLGEKLDFALAGEVERERLLQIARNVYGQLSDRPADASSNW
jgi:anti-sigma factor RsiW